MSDEREFSDERLNAFVDGELEAQERDDILAAMTRDPALGHRLCELRAAKELLRHAYDAPPAPARSFRRSAAVWRGGIAAGLALVLGLFVGWQGHRLAGGESPLAGNLAMHNPARILIHLDDASVERMEEALDVAEAYVARDDHTRIEVVVNNSGINMLRSETSPYATRIAALSSRSELISFVACGYAISRYRKAGQSVTLLPAAKVETSAVEHIVGRMRQGWTYVKI